MVLGAPVTEARINDAVSAIGDGRAARSVSVTPYVAGRVVAIEVAAGDYVRAGAPLVRLDAESEEIELDRARLTLADAEATLARGQTLIRSQAVSELQLRTAQLARDQAELALRDAELALERRAIRAPIDGWVGILGVDIGDQVTSATEVVTLDDRSHILVDFRVPERFVGQVKPGAPVSARPLALPGLDADRRGGDGRQPHQPPTPARSGCARASTTPTTCCAPAWPSRSPCAFRATSSRRSIRWRSSGTRSGAYVWVDDGGAAKQVPVRIVQRNNDAVLVDAALAPGTVVVTQGVQMLRPGAPVPLRGRRAAPATGGRTARRRAPVADLMASRADSGGTGAGSPRSSCGGRSSRWC